MSTLLHVTAIAALVSCAPAAAQRLDDRELPPTTVQLALTRHFARAELQLDLPFGRFAVDSEAWLRGRSATASMPVPERRYLTAIPAMLVNSSVRDSVSIEPTITGEIHRSLRMR